MIRSLVVCSTIAAWVLQAGPLQAQGAFPAPLPSSAANANSPFPPVNGGTANSPFPPVNGAPAATIGAPSGFPSNGAPPVSAAFAPAPQAGPPGGEECMKGFMPLRKEAERRGAAIKAASDRRAPASEACKLIGAFSQAEVKMINYVRANQQRCGIPSQIAQQLHDGHKNTEKMMKQVCTVAQQQATQPRGPVGPRLSDVLGSPAPMPQASSSKRGGSTFDTLGGNVLTR